MFYQWLEKTQKLVKVDPKEMSKEKGPIFGYMTLSSFYEYFHDLKIKEEVIKTCKRYESKDPLLTQNFLSLWEEDYFGIIGVPDTHNLFEKQDVIGWYFSSCLFLCIVFSDEDESTKAAFLRGIKKINGEQIGLGNFFSLYFRELLINYYDVFHMYQKKLEDLDKKMPNMGSNEQKIEKQIRQIHHELLGIYGYYEQLLDICQTLEENDNGIFKHKDQIHFSALANRVERYARNINLLREYANQIYASYQAQLDISLNQVMKIFTVVTTIFLPLNLIVGWYGMNFKYMPELKSPYGYPLVILVSILIVFWSIYYFKKKRYW